MTQLNQNRLITTNKILAQKFKIPKIVAVYAIKDENKKQRILRNGAWRKIYTHDKKVKLYYLPPVSFPGAISKGYINKDWRNQPYNKIKSRFDPSVMYEYQKESIDIMSRYLEDGGKAFFIRSGTATGKSYMIYGVIDKLKSKTLIVAPKKIINSQLYDDLEKHFDNVKTTGKAIGKNLDSLLKADILIITHQALNMYYDRINDAGFDTMILDEGHYCFVGGTKVDGKNIEDIKVGDYVRSFNHIKNRVEYKKVIKTFKSIPNGLVKLTSKGRSVISTPDHPFRNGLEYVEEKHRLKMFYIINPTYVFIKKAYRIYMHTMLKKIGKRFMMEKIRLQKNMKSILLQGLLKRLSQKNRIGHNEKNIKEGSGVLCSKNENKQPNVQQNYSGKNESNNENKMNKTNFTMMKLKINASTTASFIASIMTRYGSCCYYVKRFMTTISKSLQNRYCKRIVKNMNGSRLMKSLFFRKESTRQKKDGVFSIERLDNIEILKQTSDGQFGGLCRGGYVYNIEVEDNNNYFVENILVHNCPESRTVHFNKRKGRNIIGLSANRKRKDISREHFPKLYGGFYDTKQEAADVKVVPYRYNYIYKLKELIDAGQGLPVDSPEINRRLLIGNKNRVEKLLDIINIVKSKYKKIIIFTDRKEQLKKLSEALPEAYVMQGGLDNVATKNKLLELDNYILIAMEQVVREGMNIPSLEFGFLFFSSSEINTIQQLAGRVRRFAPGKEFGYLLDFVDSVQIERSKKKKVMGYYNRTKIYKDLNFNILPYEDFINKIINAPLI